MGVYDSQIALALRLIGEKGELVTWRRLFQGAPVNPAQPWKPTQPAEINIPEVPLSICWVPEGTFRRMFNSEVVAAQLYGLFSVQSFVPTLADEFERTNGDRVKVLWLDELNPNGNESVIWTLAAGSP